MGGGGQTSAAASKGKRHRISLDAAIVVATDAPVCEDRAQHSITPRTRSSKWDPRLGRQLRGNLNHERLIFLFQSCQGFIFLLAFGWGKKRVEEKKKKRTWRESLDFPLQSEAQQQQIAAVNTPPNGLLGAAPPRQNMGMRSRKIPESSPRVGGKRFPKQGQNGSAINGFHH